MAVVDVAFGMLAEGARWIWEASSTLAHRAVPKRKVLWRQILSGTSQGALLQNLDAPRAAKELPRFLTELQLNGVCGRDSLKLRFPQVAVPFGLRKLYGRVCACLPACLPARLPAD